jgi:hypothetical protein
VAENDAVPGDAPAVRVAEPRVDGIRILGRRTAGALSGPLLTRSRRPSA